MTNDRPHNSAQIHVRVSPDFKKAVKMFCVREDTSEQTWISQIIETELAKQAPDLWHIENASQKTQL